MTLTQITKIRGPGIHTTSNIVSHNINSSGIITAVAFKGPFTGSSNIQSGILTATKIDLNGDIDVDGHTNLDNVSVAGVATFASAVNTGALTATTGTFSGNVSIAGTLTYEDVTNIDSVGIITARDGLKVLAGGANVVGVVTATKGLVSPYADIDDWIDVGNNIQLGNAGVVTATSFVGGLPITNGADNRVITASSASAIQGESLLTFDGNKLLVASNSYNILEMRADENNDGGNDDNIINFTHDATLRAEIRYDESASQLKFATSDNGGHLIINTNGDIEWNNTGTSTPGYSNSTEGMGFEPRNGTIFLSRSNNITIHSNRNNDGRHIHFSQGGAQKFNIGLQNSGADLSFSSGTSEGSERFRIAADSNITQTIDTDGDGFIITAGTANIKPMLTGISNRGAVNNTIFGISGKWSSNEVGRIAFEAGADTTNKDDGHINFYTRVSGGSLTSRFHINSSGHLKIGTAAAAGGRLYFESTSGAAQYIASGGTNNQDLIVASSAGTKLQIGADGHILPGASGTQDLGSASKEWGDVYLADNKRLKLGTDQDMFVFHDNTHGYVSNRKNNLYVEAPNYVMITSTDTNGSNQQTSARFLRGGKSEIYHSDSIKFETSATGISVTGEVAATQDYPNYQPALDFNFAAVKKLDSRFTFSRTGPASYVDENGYVQLVGPNVPRFDHDPVTRESKGLLTEQSCANWIKHGTNLDSSTSWGTNGTTHTLAPTVVAPDGKTGGVWEQKENSASNYHASYYNGNIPLTNNQYYSISSWVKKGPNYRTDISSGKYQFYCTRGTGSVAYVSINSDFDTITNHGNTIDRSITQYPNGWVRVTFSFQSNASVSNAQAHWLLGNGGNYAGNGTSSVYIWGCQIEQMRFPTSYVPTNGSVVFRGTDDVTLDGTEFTDVFNPDEGTSVVYAHMPNENGASGLPTYAFKNSAVSQHTLQFSRDNNASPAYHYYHDGSNTSFTRASATVDNMYKGAMSFKTGDLDSYVNGTLNAHTTSFTMPAFDNLRIGGTSGANYLGGHVARFIYYPVKLTNNQLKTITS